MTAAANGKPQTSRMLFGDFGDFGDLFSSGGGEDSGEDSGEEPSGSQSASDESDDKANDQFGDSSGSGESTQYPTSQYSTTQDATNPVYIGCYKDDSNRDLIVRKNSGNIYTDKSCAEACKQYTFFGLQSNGECFCDESYSTPAKTYPKLPDSKCGDDRKGREWTNAVYHVRGSGNCSDPTAMRAAASCMYNAARANRQNSISSGSSDELEPTDPGSEAKSSSTSQEQTTCTSLKEVFACYPTCMCFGKDYTGDLAAYKQKYEDLGCGKGELSCGSHWQQLSACSRQDLEWVKSCTEDYSKKTGGCSPPTSAGSAQSRRLQNALDEATHSSWEELEENEEEQRHRRRHLQQGFRALATRHARRRLSTSCSEEEAAAFASCVEAVTVPEADDMCPYFEGTFACYPVCLCNDPTLQESLDTMKQLAIDAGCTAEMAFGEGGKIRSQRGAEGEYYPATEAGFADKVFDFPNYSHGSNALFAFCELGPSR
jgi:hypothetical protein